MDFSKYKDIAPYRGDDFKAALARIMDKREYLRAFVSIIAGNDFEKITSYMKMIMSHMPSCTTYAEFQTHVTAGIFIPALVEKTVREFSVSGMEKIDPEKGYLFISNHRDIILDCMLLDYALMINDKPLCEMAFGDNLITNQFVEDLFRINGGVIVRRNLPMREKYLESIKLSEYFVDVVSEENTSIWVAQKSGRSKDGLDITQPAIIKMLYLSKKGSGVSFSDLIRKVNIVPVAISYENDPNDINKGREEIKKKEDGSYEKKKYEDVISMVRGMRCNKGRVHISIGDPLTGEYQTPDEVAREIDRQIHLGYRLWDTNYIAYDALNDGKRFADQYTEDDERAFLGRFDHLSPEVRDFVLQSYANPVKSYLEAKCGV